MRYLLIAVLAACSASFPPPASADDEAEEPAASGPRGVGSHTTYSQAEDGAPPRDEDGEAPARPAPKPAAGHRQGAPDSKPSYGSVASGGGGGGAGNAAAGGKKKCAVYESLKAMPHGPNGERRVSHGVLSFTGNGQCIAVGFEIKSQSDVGRCESGESPLSPTDDACQFTYSIGKAPGSAPLGAGCKAGPVNSRGANLNFTGADPKSKLPGRGCALPPGRYYCTITASGFDHPEQPARHCGGLLASPMLQNRSD